MPTDGADAELPPQPQSGGNVIALFLALYLLILAFFILMVSISTLEDVRSQAVMDSLTSTFASILPPTTDLTTFTAKEGEILAAQEFQERITGIFATAIQVAKVTVVQPGRLMRVSMPADALFFPGEIRVREGRLPFLDRVVTALSSRPPGLRYDMEFVIDSEYAVDKSLPIGETLEMRRAGAFARVMLARGAPPDSVTIGMKPGEPGDLTIWFHVRLRDEGRLTFGRGDREGP